MLNFKTKSMIELAILVVLVLILTSFFVAGVMTIVATTLTGLVLQLVVMTALVVAAVIFTTKAYYDYELMMFKYNDYEQSNFNANNRYAYMFK